MRDCQDRQLRREVHLPVHLIVLHSWKRVRKTRKVEETFRSCRLRCESLASVGSKFNCQQRLCSHRVERFACLLKPCPKKGFSKTFEVNNCLENKMYKLASFTLQFRRSTVRPLLAIATQQRQSSTTSWIMLQY